MTRYNASNRLSRLVVKSGEGTCCVTSFLLVLLSCSNHLPSNLFYSSELTRSLFCDAYNDNSYCIYSIHRQYKPVLHVLIQQNLCAEQYTTLSHPLQKHLHLQHYQNLIAVLGRVFIARKPLYLFPNVAPSKAPSDAPSEDPSKSPST